MNSYNPSMLTMLWIHTPTWSYDHVNSYTLLMLWIHILCSYIIWIHLFQPIHNTPITQTESSFPENQIVASVNNLLHLSSDLNSWTSKFVTTHGDQIIDVSSAAQGDVSSSPSGIYPPQNITYPVPSIILMIMFFWYWC